MIPVGLYLSILKKLKTWDGDKMKGGNREVYKVPEPCGCFFTAIGMADRDRRFR